MTVNTIKRNVPDQPSLKAHSKFAGTDGRALKIAMLFRFSAVYIDITIIPQTVEKDRTAIPNVLVSHSNLRNTPNSQRHEKKQANTHSVMKARIASYLESPFPIHSHSLLIVYWVEFFEIITLQRFHSPTCISVLLLPSSSVAFIQPTLQQLVASKTNAINRSTTDDTKTTLRLSLSIFS